VPALRDYMPRTIFGRTLIMIVVPMILVQIVVAFMFYGKLWDIVTRRLAGGVAAEIAVIVRAIDHYPEGEDRDWVLSTVAATTGYRIHMASGAKFRAMRPQDASGILERVLAGSLVEQIGRPFRLDVWTHPREVIVDLQLDDGVLSIDVPRERLYTSTSYVLFLWMAGTSLIFLLIAALFLRNQVRPIRRLAAAANAFGKGRDFDNFSPAGSTEIRQAAAAFISMRQRIRRFISQRTDMLSAASHDLRTPLTRMKLELEMLPEGPLVDGLKTDVADMEKLIDSYLDFIRGEGEEQATPTNLAQLLEDVATGARRSRLDVTLETNGPLEVSLRQHAMRRCFDNLVSNAARFATELDIKAERRDEQVTVMFDDNGPGIPAEAREEVFKPFMRLESSRNQETGGLGLGLALARDVVLSHGGDITLGASPKGGLRVLVRLPV
jgi:two-component system osmolarity sensor histidine kinase EnvZ